MILGEVEKMGKRVINEAELKEIQSKLTMESEVMNKCTKIVKTTLLQCTKGDARVMVMSAGMKGALESYCRTGTLFIRVATQRCPQLCTAG